MVRSRRARARAMGYTSRLEHFPPKWTPVRRKEMRQTRESRAHPDSLEAGCALDFGRVLAGHAPEQELHFTILGRLGIRPVADHLLLGAHMADEAVNRLSEIRHG